MTARAVGGDDADSCISEEGRDIIIRQIIFFDQKMRFQHKNKWNPAENRCHQNSLILAEKTHNYPPPPPSKKKEDAKMSQKRRN